MYLYTALGFIFITFGVSHLAYSKPPIGVYFEADNSLVAEGLMEAFADPFYQRIKHREPSAIRNHIPKSPKPPYSFKELIKKAQNASSPTGSASDMARVTRDSGKIPGTSSKGNLDSEFIEFVFWVAVGEVRWSLEPSFIYLYRKIITPQAAEHLEKKVEPSIIAALYKMKLPKEIDIVVEHEPGCDWWINGTKWQQGKYQSYLGAPLVSRLVCGALWSQNLNQANASARISRHTLPEPPPQMESFQTFSQKVNRAYRLRWHLQKRIMTLTVKGTDKVKSYERVFPLDTAENADRVGDELLKVIFR